MKHKNGSGSILGKINRTDQNVSIEDIHVNEYDQFNENDQSNITSLISSSVDDLEHINRNEFVKVSF